MGSKGKSQGRATPPQSKISELPKRGIPFDPANINIEPQQIIQALHQQIGKQAAEHANENALKDCAIDMLRQNCIELASALEILRGMIEDAGLDAPETPEIVIPEGEQNNA